MTHERTSGRWRPSASEVVAQRLPQLRQRHGWTAQRLAEECAAAGAPGLNRSVIANIESGRRDFVTINEVIALAFVLDVAPVHLIVPIADVFAHNKHGSVVMDGYKITDTKASDSHRRVRAWVRGQQAIPGVDRQFFEAERPNDDTPTPDEVIAYLQSLAPPKDGE